LVGEQAGNLRYALPFSRGQYSPDPQRHRVTPGLQPECLEDDAPLGEVVSLAGEVVCVLPLSASSMTVHELKLLIKECTGALVACQDLLIDDEILSDPEARPLINVGLTSDKVTMTLVLSKPLPIFGNLI